MCQHSEDDYHGHARCDVFHLLPANCRRVLEIGTGNGSTIAALKEIRDVEFSAGVEIAENAAAAARLQVDEIAVGDIEKLDLPASWSEFNMIICLDVLEHLVDPWRLIARLHERLAQDGAILASIPNVSYYRVLLPLLFLGKWELGDAGVLDRTHLRFFVRSSIAELMTCSGLELAGLESGGTPRFSKRWWMNEVSFGILERFLVPQYYALATRARRESDGRE